MLESFARSLSQILNWVAAVAIIGMMGITSADVILRPFGLPVIGAYEMVGLLGGVTISFALAKTTLDGGHIAVKILMAKLPAKIQRGTALITQSLTFLLFAVLFWESAKYATVVRESGEVSMTIGLPFYPVIYGISFTSAVVCFLVLLDLLRLSSARTRA